MPTVLENYYNLRHEVEQRIAQGESSADAVWWYGELVYRIGVLETCQMCIRDSATILKEVIEETEGIQMTACDDYNSVTYLLYQPSYPWELTDQERNLTEQQVAEIIGRHVRILTSKPIEIDYQAVENGG